MALVIMMAGFGGGDLKNSTGAPPQNTNSPGDGQNCTHCMGGTATAVTGWITSDVPASGYVPGSTYTITVTVPGAGKKGFEVSPQDISGNLIGTLTAGSGNKLVGTNKYVTHSTAVSTNPAVWTFHWTAPAGGAGSVTFYGSMAITQTVTKTTTLTIAQTTAGIPALTAADWICYPNPAHDRLFIKINEKQEEPLKIELFSLTGSLVQEPLTTTLPAGEKILEIPLNQPAGLYLLRLTGENSTQLKKLLIQ